MGQLKTYKGPKLKCASGHDKTFTITRVEDVGIVIRWNPSHTSIVINDDQKYPAVSIIREPNKTYGTLVHLAVHDDGGAYDAGVLHLDVVDTKTLNRLRSQLKKNGITVFSHTRR